MWVPWWYRYIKALEDYMLMKHKEEKKNTGLCCLCKKMIITDETILRCHLITASKHTNLKRVLLLDLYSSNCQNRYSWCYNRRKCLFKICAHIYFYFRPMMPWVPHGTGCTSFHLSLLGRSLYLTWYLVSSLGEYDFCVCVYICIKLLPVPANACLNYGFIKILSFHPSTLLSPVNLPRRGRGWRTDEPSWSCAANSRWKENWTATEPG